MTYYYPPRGFYLATTGSEKYHLFEDDTIKPCCWSISPMTADDIQVARNIPAWRVCGWCKRMLAKNKQAA